MTKMKIDESRIFKKIVLIFSSLFSLLLIGMCLFSSSYISSVSPGNDTLNVVITIGLTANFTYQPLNPKSGDVITFIDTSESDIPLINWTWDFGDGSMLSYEKNTSHSYSSAGIFHVTHTVKKTSNISDTISKGITVTSSSGSWNPPPMPHPRNRPPCTKINVPTYGQQSQLIICNGSGSYDPDGVIVSYIWDFGDGTIENGVVVTHSYARIGNYTITLMITDNNGSTSSNSTMIFIAEEKPGFLFDVYLELEPNVVFLGQNITGLITLINVGQPSMVNGTLTSTIYNNGIVVQFEKENVSILGQKVITKLILTKGLDVGRYIYEVVYSYSNATASTHASFTIKPIPSSSPTAPLFVIIILLMIIVIAVVTFFVFIFSRKKRKEITISLMLESASAYPGQPINVSISITSPRWRKINGTIIYSMFKQEAMIWSEEENISVFRRKEINKIMSTKGVPAGDYICDVIFITDGGMTTTSARAFFTINLVLMQ
jgi:PKD repeat protein